MKKQMYTEMLFSLIMLGSSWATEPVVSFGYNNQAIEKYEQQVPGLIRTAQLKRAAVIGAFGTAALFYAYSTLNKVIYYQPPVTVSTQNLGWIPYGAHAVFSLGEQAGQFCAGFLLNHYAGNLVTKFDISFDYVWFIRSHTQFSTVFNNVKEELEYLPLIEDNDRVIHKLADIRCQIGWLVSDVMRIIGYMQYRQKLEEKEDHIFASVMMQGVIQDMHTVTMSLCMEMELLLNTYNPINKTAQDYAEATKMLLRLESCGEAVCRNIKTFGMYEKGTGSLGGLAL